MNYKKHIFKNSEETARAVAELIKENAISFDSESRQYNIALSGGSTPTQLFKLLADEYENQIPWSAVRFFWVDERCVEPTDTESNYGVAYDTLFQKGFIPKQNIFRMKGEEIPTDEAKRYSELLDNELPTSNKFPVFDLVLLGIGDDGHTASIFPYNIELLNSEKSVAVSQHPISRQKRITLTGKTICNAKDIIFMAVGEGKRKILQEIIHKELIAQKYPASFIQNNLGEVEFYMDESAAKDLY